VVCKVTAVFIEDLRPGVLNRGPRPPKGSKERLSGDHEQMPLLNSSDVILQNLIDCQGGTSVNNLWKGAINHENFSTTVLDKILLIGRICSTKLAPQFEQKP